MSSKAAEGWIFNTCQICIRIVKYLIINDISEGSKWIEKYFDLRRWHIYSLKYRGSGILLIT